MIHSYSSLDMFNSCPRKFNEIKILKNFTPAPYVESEEGKAFHAAMERLLTLHVAIPENMERYRAEIEMLIKMPGVKHAELKMGLKPDGSPCDFWDKTALIRGAADLVVIQGDHAIIADYKFAGKFRPKPEQLHIMATMLFAKYKHLKTITGVLMFLNQKQLHTEKFVVENFIPMWSHWQAKMHRQEKMMAENDFPPHPSGLCGAYCEVLSCEHNGRNS